jgi:hypothetical protein
MADHEKVLRHGLRRLGIGHGRPQPRSDERERDPEEGSLLVSPGFWVGALFCLLIWVSLAFVFGWL